MSKEISLGSFDRSSISFQNESCGSGILHLSKTVAGGLHFELTDNSKPVVSWWGEAGMRSLQTKSVPGVWKHIDSSRYTTFKLVENL